MAGSRPTGSGSGGAPGPGSGCGALRGRSTAEYAPMRRRASFASLMMAVTFSAPQITSELRLPRERLHQG